MKSFINVCKSEFYKLRTQKSAIILSIVSILIYPIVTSLAIFILKFASTTDLMKGKYTEVQLLQMLGWSNISVGEGSAAICVMVFAILYFTTEFQSGSISSTLISTPDRIKLYFAKFTALFIFVYIIGIIGEILAYLSTIPFLLNVEGQNLLLTITSPDNFRFILGGPLMLAFVGVFFLALGCLIRSTAASIVIYFVIAFVLPGGLSSAAMAMDSTHKDLAQLISGVQAFLPLSGSDAFLSSASSNSAAAVSSDGRVLDYIVTLTNLQGLLVFSLWVVVITFFAVFFFKKRDIK
ncbi:MAG: ABC transporter permease subunit [Bifidobacteriaceae bacterium]|jgi:ABC-type transport system involved in multi-copper enzyme maturation permease subunit|nr:ABC transporter permease subunit [Bifidobacteriaceae bacterium]